MKQLPRYILIGLVVMMLVGAIILLAIAASGATAPPEGEQLRIEVNSDASADLTVVNRYNLSDTSEKTAFREITENESAMEQHESRFESRLQAAVSRVNQTTERQMGLSEVDASAHTANGSGFVVMSVTWTNLAESTESGLHLAEPFNNGFSASHRLVVVAPDGMEASTTGSADIVEAQRLVWADGSPSDENFSVQFSSTTTEQKDSVDNVDAPGFGFLVVTLSISGGVVLARVST